MIVQRLPVSVGSVRTLTLSQAALRDFKEGRKIIHGRHQLPYWQDRDRKQVQIYTFGIFRLILEFPKYKLLRRL